MISNDHCSNYVQFRKCMFQSCYFQPRLTRVLLVYHQSMVYHKIWCCYVAPIFYIFFAFKYILQNCLNTFFQQHMIRKFTSFHPNALSALTDLDKNVRQVVEARSINLQNYAGVTFKIYNTSKLMIWSTERQQIITDVN